MKYPGFIMLIIAAWLSCNTDIKNSNSATDTWWTEVDRNLILSELDRTTGALREEVINLSQTQWHFKEDSTRWSIAEIVEHLEMQNLLHYREISVTSKAPQNPEFRAITKGQDSHFTKYSTDPVKSTARWFLQPRQRYDQKNEGWAAFLMARSELKKFVAETDIDLRKQYTYRSSVSDKDIGELKIGEVRDLHQLLLTGIAHTDRHLRQIRAIKNHPEYSD